MSVIKMVLKKYIKIPKLDSFKNVVFVGPHADDIEFGCGATISKLKENGANIHFIIVTDGASGTKDKNEDPMILKKTREEEAVASSKYLGAQTIDFLEFEDGGIYTKEDVIKKIAPLILKYNPEIIFTTDPSLKTECHPDHIKTGEAIKELMQLIGYPESLRRHGVDVTSFDVFPRNVFLAMYFTDSPNTRVKFKKKHWAKKETSIKMHKSQIDDSIGLLITYFKAKSIESGIKHFKGRCEDYKVYHPMMQHVYSEGF